MDQVIGFVQGIPVFETRRVMDREEEANENHSLSEGEALLADLEAEGEEV